MSATGGKEPVGRLASGVAYARKILLRSPVADEGQLGPFVEQCLKDKVSIVAVFSPGSQRIEDIIDEIVVGDGSNPERFVCTTSHQDEPLDDVLNMLQCWELERHDQIQVVRL